MSVNLHGTRAEVLVREKLPTPELRDETTPAHVISAATGIITHMEVLEGQPSFQEGDTVLEGEVLISGVVDLKEPKYATVDAGSAWSMPEATSTPGHGGPWRPRSRWRPR